MSRILNLIPRTERFMSLIPEMDLLGPFFDDLELPDLFSKEKSLVPAFDIAETKKEYTITGEIPGMDVKDLEVTLSDGILTVTGEKKHEKEDKGENYYRVERQYGSFQRSFRLPEDVKTEKSKATYKDGILKLTLPKTSVPKTKKVEVNENKPRKRSKPKKKVQ
jgi:HSP20 family protein